MANKSEVAAVKFLSGFNCAQSVFYAYCDDLQFDKNTALRLACGFGAGMGRKEEVCGAVTGGIIVIGLKYGRDDTGDGARSETTYKKTSELMERFAEKHGTYRCRDLLKGCDLASESGQKQFKEMEMKKNICALCVKTVIAILEKIV
jgi:C_GCAxxG_C_C family probable redox protein